MAVTTVAMPSNPALALTANIRALDLFDWPSRWRRQLSASFVRVMTLYHGRVQITPEAASQIYEIGLSTSPVEPIVMVARAHYVLNYGGDLTPIRDAMVKYAPLSAETWLVAAYWHIQRGNADGARAAIKQGKSIPYVAEKTARQMDELERILQ